MARLISERIIPVPGCIGIGRMARGEPGLPERFTWRGQEYLVDSLIEARKTASPENTRPGADVYVRRHYFTVSCQSGEVMTIYCERQPHRPNAAARWWLYTIEE